MGGRFFYYYYLFIYLFLHNIEVLLWSFLSVQGCVVAVELCENQFKETKRNTPHRD